MKKLISLLTVLFVLMLSVAVFAAPLIQVSMKAEKEVIVNKVAKKIAAEKVNPGDVIYYTINYVNSGNEEATNAFLDDPIPKGTVYITGSAFGENTDITFSIDGGKTFKKPSLLTYEVKTAEGKIEKRSASPEKYTHIRWTVNTIPAGGKGKVGFQVKMK